MRKIRNMVWGRQEKKTNKQAEYVTCIKSIGAYFIEVPHMD